MANVTVYVVMVVVMRERSRSAENGKHRYGDRQHSSGQSPAHTCHAEILGGLAARPEPRGRFGHDVSVTNVTPRAEER